jgi:hypothetical protein
MARDPALASQAQAAIKQDGHALEAVTRLAGAGTVDNRD